ncbi:hypothetical protein KFL_000880240 [Klebsormidium nitens]|uniref:WD repeat-containing protein 19 n=1 Tax=Klebsormidium nitens TaxID=105231 RepID=A0A1Y1HX18_KLENI|nr:hypothetical protein KFL_000880240 [Klebsormidium nitens]|eukprot:GAQ81709.1 hypothetical protein KFL_000880240 [Klebsormidium nitens]
MKKLFTIDASQNGRGSVAFTWSPRGTHLAVAGTQRRVCIYLRSGQLYDEILLPEPDGKISSSEADLSCCITLAWDAPGDTLAILQRGGYSILLYAPATKERTKVETGMKELTFLSWAKSGPVLAVGTAKGNLLLYNQALGKRIPIMGKHTKRITCGAWSAGNRLALGSDDRRVSVSTDAGDTIKELSMKSEPVEVTFADMKDDSGASGPKMENTVCVNVGRKTLYLYRLSDKEGDKPTTPLELAFQDVYGQILCHRWFGDGYVLLGFSTGHIVIVSTHTKELSEEVHSAKILKDGVSDVAYCAALDRVATCGGNTVKFVDLRGLEFKEIKSDQLTLDAGAKCARVQWTRDGQVLTVATKDGELHGFLATLPAVCASWDARVAHLTSLQELSVEDTLGQGIALRVELFAEPAACALGPLHCAAAAANQAWFYHLPGDGLASPSMLESHKEYSGDVQEIRLNSRFAAVLVNGRIELHTLSSPGETPTDPEEAPPPHFTLPEGDQVGTDTITTVALTEASLICATSGGEVLYYFLDPHTGPALINECKHPGGKIHRLSSNPLGTRVALLDGHGAVVLYNPVTDEALPVPTGQNVEAVLWDLCDPGVFFVVEPGQIVCHVYSPVTVSSPTITVVGATPRPLGHCPITVYHGVVTCLVQGGGLEGFTLTSHTRLQGTEARFAEAGAERFEQNLALLRLKPAFMEALLLKKQDAWERLARAALRELDVDLAARAFRQLGDAGMVQSLLGIAHVEEIHLLAGHVLLLLGEDYDAAQERFLQSSRPIAALEMRKDLRQWDQALKLARQLDPSSVGDISREYAQLLEMRGEFQPALDYYNQALASATNDDEKRASARAGVARVTIQLGDVRRGRQLALECASAQLCRECAAILEGMNHMQDAAELYERGGQEEKAASIYIATRNFAAAQPLLARISAPKLHLQYAKAKEADGKFDAAAAAYEAAGEMDHMVRLLLGPLQNPQKGFAIARGTRSADAAAMAAKHCLMSGNYAEAVEFLVLSKRPEEAFELAQTHDTMDAYAALVADGAAPDGTLRLAKYYESRTAFGKAARFYDKCGQAKQALRLYLRSGAEGDIEQAIEMVGRRKDDELTGQLVDYLVEGAEQTLKNHNLLFKLHLELGDFVQAAKMAVLIARQEQEAGNYKVAHTQLLQTFLELQSHGRRPPSELSRQLMLLHSYVLVKTLVKLGDHESAARMLIRVSRNISKFPAHVVPILTSTVIECQRSGLRNTAFEYASMLMRPEYRASIAAAYKKKIEDVVRRRERGDEADEPAAACPHCAAAIPATQLECPSCKNSLPYCVATGRHMVLGDWTTCPECTFPALASELTKVLELDGCCPMCSARLDPSALQLLANPLAGLRKNA